MEGGGKLSNGAGNVRQKVHVDVTSDTVCPWCFVGKKRLEEAIKQTQDKYDVEVQWHPFLLNPKAPKEGVDKRNYYISKFGESRVPSMEGQMKEVYKEPSDSLPCLLSHQQFSAYGLDYSLGGKTGNTLDSHRLLEYAAKQGLDKQNALVDELFKKYFSEEKYIGDRRPSVHTNREVLIAAADKVGIKGAREYLEDDNAGLKEVKMGLSKHARGVTGVPHFVINNRCQLSGAQPAESFVEAFKIATEDA
eukprot:SM000031S11582  [mRNA]  locus=s31:493266:495505:+ [translate_table: standard]